MQTIASLECRKMGLPHSIPVGAAHLPKYILASYNHTTRDIIISLDSLANGTAADVLTSVCHETYHCYEYRIVSLWKTASEEDKNLMLFEEAKAYSSEFDGPLRIVGEAYYTQASEVDARAYAEAAAKEYYRCIEEYLTGITSEGDDGHTDR